MIVKGVKAMNLKSTAEQFALIFFVCVALSVLFIIFSVLFISASLMKQCENFILCV